jgi:kynurenine 3-monooxygenase
MKKVTIVGAGPCGVLLAHYLLRRGDNYQINLYDRRSDPRAVSFANYRTYPLALSVRGLSAIRQIEGLEAAVKAQGTEVVCTISHLGNGKTRVLPRRQPIITIDRTRLAIALLNSLTQKYDSSRLNISFDCQCTEVNLNSQQATFVKESDTFTENYEYLVGADGARSTVRNALLNTSLFEFEQKYVRDDYKTFYLPRHNKNTTFKIQPHHIHGWRNDKGINILAVPQPDDTVSCVIIFPRHQNPFLNLSRKEEVLSFLAKTFPEVAQLMSETEAEALLQRPISRVPMIRCARYHQGDRLLILGDAAHAVSPSLGQGCNAAMEDVVIFDRILDEFDDNWSEALPQFSQRRLPDAHAVLTLCDDPFPRSKKLFFEFILRLQLGRTLHKIFPERFPLFLFDLIADTTVPYSKILDLYRGWVTKVKQSNEQFLAKSQDC